MRLILSPRRRLAVAILVAGLAFDADNRLGRPAASWLDAAVVAASSVGSSGGGTPAIGRRRTRGHGNAAHRRGLPDRDGNDR